MAKMIILDVGHGNCTVIEDAGKVVLVDTAGKTKIQGYLDEYKISVIDIVVISHSDHDHIGGLINLLSNEKYTVKRVVLNPDSIKESRLWEDVRFLIDEKERDNGLHVEFAVKSSVQPEWAKVSENLSLEIVSPSRAMLLSGPGQFMPQDTRRLTSNSVSVVVRVVYNQVPIALLCGDMDQIALDNIKAHNILCAATYLIYPHHGGLPGNSDVLSFTRDLIGWVSPSFIIFSNGRGKYNNPAPQVIESIIAVSPNINLMCTQISKTCCVDVVRPDYLPKVYSVGFESGSSCAGSIEISLEDGSIDSQELRIHQDFVTGLETSLCKKK